jgi:hypothetical protein
LSSQRSPEDRGLQLGLAEVRGQAEKVEDVGVAEDQVRRHPVLVPQLLERALDDGVRALGNRSPLEEHPVHLALEGPDDPARE